MTEIPMRKNRILAVLLAAAGFSACSDDVGEVAPEPTAAEAATGDEAVSQWLATMGVWAPEGACGDMQQEWRLEAGSFHLFETHCAIEKLELIENGVRAQAQCSVEGDNDQIPDVFRFERREDATLSIVNEANEFSADGLVSCQGEAP